VRRQRPWSAPGSAKWIIAISVFASDLTVAFGNAAKIAWKTNVLEPRNVQISKAEGFPLSPVPPYVNAR
jgi:hypothetical protein